MESLVNPDGVELCDEIDNDCNGIVNDNASDILWYEDSDVDGYGTRRAPQRYSTDWLLSNDGDCDDGNVAGTPAALEFCNEVDDDCDGVIDDSDVVDFLVFFADVDGDSFGDSSSVIQACEQGPGMVSNNQDCDDETQYFPYATEICNGLDDNCNTVIDEGALDLQLYFKDNDGGGFGSGLTIGLFGRCGLSRDQRLQ